MGFVIPAPALPSVAVEGTTNRFPLRRIFCVGRNYAEHTREMGGDPRFMAGHIPATTLLSAAAIPAAIWFAGLFG